MYIKDFGLFMKVENSVREDSRVLIAFPVLHIDSSDLQNLGLRDEAFPDVRKSFISCRKLVVVNDTPGAGCRFSFVSLNSGL